METFKNREALRRLAPHAYAACEAELAAAYAPFGASHALAWGPQEGTHGRVFVRNFRLWVCGPTVVEIRLDGRIVWRSLSAYQLVGGAPELHGGWVPDEIGAAARAEEREAGRRLHARREADRAIILAAIAAGRPVNYDEGQCGGAFWLPETADRVSARHVYRALTGGWTNPATGAGWEEFQAWVEEVTNPPEPTRIPRRAAACPVQWDMIAAG